MTPATAIGSKTGESLAVTQPAPQQRNPIKLSTTATAIAVSELHNIAACLGVGGGKNDCGLSSMSRIHHATIKKGAHYNFGSSFEASPNTLALSLAARTAFIKAARTPPFSS